MSPTPVAPPLRLLFISNHYPPQHFGGYEELCQEVATGLRERGHHVTILTSRPSGRRRGTAPDEVSVIRALEPEVAVGEPWATARLLLGGRRRSARNRAAVDAALQQHRPQAVVVWGMWNLSSDVARRLETAVGEHLLYYAADVGLSLPDAVSQHFGAPARRPFFRPLKRWLARLAARGRPRRLGDGLRLARMACVSQDLRAALQAQGLAPADAEVIHNGIDTARFAPRPDGPPAAPPLRLLVAGRLSPDKGLDVALEAVGLVHRAGVSLELSLVGSIAPGAEEALTTRIQAEGLRDHARLTGPMPREAMPAVLGQHHLLLIPSTAYDALPRSAQEGMACGLAVIASRIGGLPELIEDGVSGLLVPPGDAASLAAAIARLATEPELRVRLGQAGRERVQAAFDIGRTVELVEARLQSIAADDPPA